MARAAAQKAIESADEQAGKMAPGYISCMFACCGGPVSTLKKFEFAVPADQKDNFKSLVSTYDDAQKKIAELPKE